VVGQPAVYDYSQPISYQSPPPDDTVISQAIGTFDQAREAFKREDYAEALGLVDQALRQSPNDPTLHEFRALALFALGRYDEAAAALYSVLSVGPGWDWTTLIGLYSNPEAYTQQLRDLERYTSEHPQSAAPRLVLAYHYLTEGHADAALGPLKAVVALQPKDKLSAQLIQRLEQPQSAATGSDLALNQATPPSPGSVGAAGTPTTAAIPSTGKEGELEGTWRAQPDKDTTITATFNGQGHFAWKVIHQGQEHQFEGNLSYVSGVLTLAQDSNNAMVGQVNWQDGNHFNFKVLGGGPDDPGLTFTKTV
jgi:tetratricopeptide (TPR) repeat protein